MRSGKNFYLKLLILLSIFFNTSCSVSKLEKVTKSEALVDKLEINLENKGVGGNTTVDLIERLEVDVLSKNPDLVILMVGTNDMLNSRKFVSYEDYKTNLIGIVKRIKNTEAEVLLMSPPTVDSAYLFMRHDKTLYMETPNVKLQKTKVIIEQIAIENNVHYLDLNGLFMAKGLPIHNQDDYIINEKNSNKKDGVHLTPLGYRYIAENIFKYLEIRSLTNEFKNIICFGDSLTKGSGTEGAGTIIGENYPSFLFRMLTNIR